MATTNGNMVRYRPNILIVGTPGTGKTTISQQIADRTDMTHMDVNEIARENNFYDGYDDDRACNILDEDRVVDFMEDRISSTEGGTIVDYHGCEFFPERWFDAVFVLRTDNTKLYDRLTSRGYSEKKVQENVECEIFGTLAEEARLSYKEGIIYELQNDTVDDMEENVSKILTWIQSWKPCH